MIHMLVLAALTALPPCWNIFDGALRHSANGAHPPYVTYSERISVTEDGMPLVRSFANVDYRDDGVARVSDERFNYQAYLTRRAEPGPPEIGPYGSGRDMWLPYSRGVPVIARVRSQGRVRCTIDEEQYKSRQTYHLTFTGGLQNRPRLEEMWVDVHSSDVWKLIVTGPVNFLGDDGTPTLARFQVELGYQGPYLVVNHVVWTYQRRIYSQYAEYFGEYTFSGYAFPKDIPASYFGDTITALK